MTAGGSAGRERERSLLEAEAHERAAAEARRRAAVFGVAARTEPITASALEALSGYGWSLLHDRKWPGTLGTWAQTLTLRLVSGSSGNDGPTSSR